jgi:hypothetical protein
MDPRRFEAVSRRIATAATRRDALFAFAGGVAGAILGPTRQNAAAAPNPAGAPIVHCKIPGQKCKRDDNCCSRRCSGGICGCSKRGSRCWQPLEGGLCCSARCHKGKCQ